MSLRTMTVLQAYMYLMDNPDVCESFIETQNTNPINHLSQGYWPKFPDRLKLLCLDNDSKTKKQRDGQAVMNELYQSANRRFDKEIRLLDKVLDEIIERQ